MSDIPSLQLPSGEPVPVLGHGPWNMAEEKGRRADEIAALCLGLDLIDTAEMYAKRGSETLVGEGVVGRRYEISARHAAIGT